MTKATTAPEKYIGSLNTECGESELHIVRRGAWLIAGTACNVGLLDDYAIKIEDGETEQEALEEFAADLEEIDANGIEHTSGRTIPATMYHAAIREANADKFASTQRA